MSLITPEFKPSRFRLQSLGPQLAYNQTYNPRFQYFGSEDYEHDISTIEQRHLEEQMLAIIAQQSLQMLQKNSPKLTLVDKQQKDQKKKKVFDSADYYMQQEAHRQQKTIEQQQEDALLCKYAASNSKPALIKKQKKMFDSADYFLALYKS